MHYIVGTKIIINTAPERHHSSGLKSVGAAKISKRVNTTNFQPGNQYSLYHIKKQQNNFLYTFKNESSGETVFVPFDSTLDADKHIASLLGEKLPNYKKNYENNSG
jgi:hypothetical protein